MLDISVFPVRDAVLVYLNNGNGFAEPVTYSLSGLFPQCIEAADVTGDGALDLVVCHSRSAGAGNVEGLITVLAGQRTGSVPNGAFQQIYSDVVGTAPSAAASADIDGDGRVDLLVVDPAEQRVLVLYGSSGPSRFESPAELDVVPAPIAALANAVPGQPLPQVLVVTASGGRLLTYSRPRRAASRLRPSSASRLYRPRSRSARSTTTTSTTCWCSVPSAPRSGTDRPTARSTSASRGWTTTRSTGWRWPTSTATASSTSPPAPRRRIG